LSKVRTIAARPLRQSFCPLFKRVSPLRFLSTGVAILPARQRRHRKEMMKAEGSMMNKEQLPFIHH
jgi:hypothetical protein